MNVTNQFSISGITCQACLKLINNLISDINGVIKVDVHLSGKTSITTQRPLLLSEITQALTDTDYKVTN